MSEESNEVPEEAFERGRNAARALDQKTVQLRRYGSPSVHAIVPPKYLIVEGQYRTLAEAAEVALREMLNERRD